MMMMNMIDLVSDSSFSFLWIVTMEQSLEVSGSVLQLVLDWVPDLPEEPVGLARPPPGQTVEVPHHTLLPGETDEGHEEDAEQHSHPHPAAQCARSQSSDKTDWWIDLS